MNGLGDPVPYPDGELRLLKPNEVAKRLQIGVREVYRLCEKGELAFLAGPVRIPEGELRAYIERHLIRNKLAAEDARSRFEPEKILAKMRADGSLERLFEAARKWPPTARGSLQGRPSRRRPSGPG